MSASFVSIYLTPLKINKLEAAEFRAEQLMDAVMEFVRKEYPECKDVFHWDCAETVEMSLISYY